MTTLKLTRTEMQYFTDLGEAFGLAEDMIMAALDTLTDELQRGVDAYYAEQDREDGDPPVDRQVLDLFLEEIQELDFVRDPINEYKGRLKMLKRRWLLPEPMAAA